MRAVWCGIAVGLLAHVIVGGRAAAAVVEPGFTETVLVAAPELADATAMAWAPDGSGRLFVLRKGGEVRVIKGGRLLPAPFVTVTPLHQGGECGLLGIAFDPDFLSTGHVYLFATVSTTEQQIIRYTARGDVGADKATVVPGLPTIGADHDGGALGISPADGKLYWGVGDNKGPAGIDGDLALLNSKVGRANLDGSTPADNPFVDGAGPNADLIWARGFRNPFTLTFQPATGLLWVNDVGRFYEQIFVVRRGDHAGWLRYEGVQPDGYIAPVIRYPTNITDVRPIAAAAMSGAVRAGGRLTVTTPAPHGFRRGEKITIAGVADPSFAGAGYVAAVPGPTTFVIPQVGPDAVSGGGTASTLPIGGAVTGGAFYDATAWPAGYRGNFFFADYNTGRIMRAVIDPASNAVTAVDYWASGVSHAVDIAVGPDGALYYVGTDTNAVLRASFGATAQGVVVAPVDLWLEEGQAGVVTVSLAMKPAQPTAVNVARAGGDGDIGVVDPAGGTLMFTEADWNVPRAVKIVAGRDLDATDDAAAVAFAVAGGGPSETVQVRARDDNGVALVVSPAALAMGEGGSASVSVALSRRPSLEVVVTVARGDGDADVAVSAGGRLTFDSGNWSVAQMATLSAAQDADAVDDRAAVTVTSPGMAAQSVAVTVRDDDARAPVITSMPLVAGVVGGAYRYHVEASGLPPPGFSLEMAPAGMMIDRDSGVIAWTPTAAGSFMVGVRAANGVAPDAVQRFVVEVAADRPPACALDRPQPGEVVRGTNASFSGRGMDDVGVAKAEFHVDGQLSDTQVGAAGTYHHGGAAMRWDVSKLAGGPHVAKIVVFDTGGQTCAAEATVMVASGEARDAGAAPVDAGGTSDARTGGGGSPPVQGCECRAATGGRARAGGGLLLVVLLAAIRARREWRSRMGRGRG